MARIIVCDIEDDVCGKILAMANAHDRRMEDEIRAILREAARRAPIETGEGLGTRISRRFRGRGPRTPRSRS